jgi:hypothetical protein
MNKKLTRKKKTRLRKNFFPTLLVIVTLWSLLGLIIIFTSPYTVGSLILFFIILFAAVLFTFSLVFANTRRGFLIALGIIVFLILRYFGIGNILNLLLIVGALISVDFYLTKGNS